jgi:hypothetical protein
MKDLEKMFHEKAVQSKYLSGYVKDRARAEKLVSLILIKDY